MRDVVDAPKGQSPFLIFWSILLRNWRPLLWFELIYKLVSIVVVVPLLRIAIKLILRIEGYGYLSGENLTAVLREPITIVCGIILLFLLSAYTMIDVNAIIWILDMSFYKEKIHAFQALKFSLKKSARAFHPKNYMLLVFLIFMLPFFNVGLTSSFVGYVTFPEFISKYIHSHIWLFTLVLIGELGIFYVMVRWSYSLHYFVLEDMDFKEAHKYSAWLIEKRKIADIARFAGLQICLYFVFFLVNELIAYLTYLSVVNLGHLKIFYALTKAATWESSLLCLGIYTLLSTPAGYACMTALFIHHSQKDGAPIEKLDIPDNSIFGYVWETDKFLRWLHRIEAIVIVVALIAASGFNLKTLLKKDDNVIPKAEISAHRGASVNYPENTMAAFEGAKKQGADWIELDVQQSKDGQIFVLHDANFKRVGDVDKNSWELTYDEIKKIDVGSSFDESFAGEKVPLLSEVIEWAKENDIRLNIELKPTGHEENFEKQVVDIINDSGFKNQCVVTSQVYEVLENVKQADEKVFTVYVMSVALGDLELLTAADALSIEGNNISSSMVKSVHKSGKEIYAWTLNSAEKIAEMQDMGVDNIITDDVVLANAVLSNTMKEGEIKSFDFKADLIEKLKFWNYFSLNF